MKTNFFSRYGLWILLFTAFSVPFVARGARKAVQSNRNDVSQWLPAEYPETQVYQRFREKFENEEFVLASWEGCTLDDPRLELLAQKLVPPEGQKPSYGPRRLFSTALTGARAAEEMTAPPLNLELTTAIERLRGSLIGHDQATTCLVLTLSPAGKEDLGRTIDAIYDTAQQECAIPQDEMYLGGPPVDNVAIDRAGEKSLVRLAGLSGLVGIIVSWLSLRSGRLIAMVFATGLYSVLAALAVVWITGTEVNAILLTMPSLVYVATTSGAIHLANYYRDTIREEGIAGGALRALMHARLPLTLAAITTAAGLMTLYTNELVPIRVFGLYSAIGVMISLLVLFLVLPSCLELWPLRSEAGTPEAPKPRSDDTPAARWWYGVGDWIIRHHVLSFLGCAAIFIGCGYGLTQVKQSVQLMRLFSQGARILEDYAWLEENVGELVPMEIMLEIDPDQSGLSFLERMELVNRVHRRVESLEHVGSALSAVTFAPPLPDPRDGRRLGPLGAIMGGYRSVRAAWESELEDHRQQFLDGDYVQQVDDQEFWRVTARVGALEDVDYGVFVYEIKREIEPILGVYHDRQRIRNALREADEASQIAGSRICVVGIGDPDEPGKPSDEALTLLDLLSANGAVVSYHDPNVPKINNVKAAKHIRGRQRRSVELNPGFLSAQDCLVVTTVGEKWLEGLAPDAPVVEALRTEIPSVEVLAAQDDVTASYVNVPGMDVTYTGLVPLVYKAQHHLLNNLVWGFIIDLVIVGVVMVIVVRDLAAGVILLASAVFPAVVIFGLMGWFGIVVDTGTVMTPAVALGVTVDDVVHFMLWFRRGHAAGLSRGESVMLAYRGCARAMYQSWGVIGLGLSVFAVSPFTPTQRFGQMMLTLLTAALVGNLVLLPALLAGPLGGLFGRRTRRQALKQKSQPANPDASPALGMPFSEERPNLPKPHVASAKKPEEIGIFGGSGQQSPTNAAKS